MEESIHRHGIVLEHLSAIDWLSSKPSDPGADRPRLSPDHLARTSDDVIGVVSGLRNVITPRPWLLLAQPEGCGVLRPPNRPAGASPALPLCCPRLPAAHVHRTVARHRWCASTPDGPVARRAPEHRPGARRQSRLPSCRDHGRADQPHHAAAPRPHRHRHTGFPGDGARGGRLGMAQGPPLRHDPVRPRTPARHRPAAGPRRRHAGGVAGGPPRRARRGARPGRRLRRRGSPWSARRHADRRSLAPAAQQPRGLAWGP